MPVTLDVPILSPFPVPPGPQSGRWRNTNVLPPPSALLLEGLFLLWLTFSLLFVFKKQLFQLFLSQPSMKDPGRQRRRQVGRELQSCVIPWQTGLRCRTRTEPPAGWRQAWLAIRSWVQEVSGSVVISHLETCPCEVVWSG